MVIFASFGAICHTKGMLSEYQQLVSDARRLLQEYDPAEMLLTSHFFSAPTLPSPIIKKVSPIPPVPKPIIKPATPLVEDVQQVVEPTSPVAAPVFLGAQIKELLQKIAPHVKIIDPVPEDTVAQRITSSWKEKQWNSEIVVLSFDETEKEKLFLYNLAKAIDTAIRPCRVLDGRRLEKENKWERLIEHKELRYVFAPPVLANWPGLMQLYKELPATQEIHLGDKPLFLLDKISFYFNNPSSKRTLWQRICSLR